MPRRQPRVATSRPALEEIAHRLQELQELVRERIGLADGPASDEAPPGEALSILSPREREVLDEIGHRYTDREIAEHLGVSLRTVQRHAAAIFLKLGVQDRREAVGRYQAPTGADVPGAASFELTRPEVEVLRGIDAGHSHQEIAERLGISVGAVVQHAHSVHQKLYARSAGEAGLERGHGI